jgi:hypothetical protein
MTLGYNFQPVDVELPDHPRVKRIEKRHRRAALGLYVAALCYARKHTPGVVPRAFAEDDDPRVVSELVRVGLWVEREDGDWDIHNWEKKSPGRKKSSEPPGASTPRVQKLRNRKAGAANETDVTVSETVVTDSVARASSSPSISPSVSSSDLCPADQINLTGGSRPPWADAAFASAEMSTGETFDRGTVWFTYANARDDAGRPTNASDFKRYLGSWASRQKSERVNRPKRPAEITKQPYDPDAPWLKAGGDD